MKKRIYITVLMLLMCSIVYDVNAQIDSLNSEEIKELLSGEWKRKGKIVRFVYGLNDDSTDTHLTKSIISTTPIFKIYKKHDMWYFSSIGSNENKEPWRIKIIVLNKEKFIMEDYKNGTRWKYYRK